MEIADLLTGPDAVLACVKAYATLGEMCNLLRGVYGEYREAALV